MPSFNPRLSNSGAGQTQAVPPPPSVCKAPRKAPSRSITVWRNKLIQHAQSDTLAKLVERAGLIGKEQLCDAMEIAESLKKTLDQVLVTSFLNDRQFEICGQAILYLERDLITEALAADGIMAANHKNISFAEGLKYFGYGW